MTDEELIELQTKNPKAFAELFEAGLSAQVALARQDINVFNEFVLRDERTQDPIKQSPAHIEMHKFLDETKYAVVWGAIDFGKCLDHQTLLVDANTQPVTAETLYRRHLAGEALEVWTVDYAQRGWRKVRVKSVFDNGTRPCVRVTTADGHVSVVTKNHPFLAGSRVYNRYVTFWREAQCLTSSAYVFAPGTHPVPEEPVDPHVWGEAFAVGFVLSLLQQGGRDARDANGGVQLKFKGQTPGEVHDVATLARWLAKGLGWVYDEEYLGPDGVVFTLSQLGHSVVEWLRGRGVGITYDFRAGRWERTVTVDGLGGVPTWVWSTGRETTLGYLRGWAATRLRVRGEKVALQTNPGDAPIVAQLMRKVNVAVRVKPGSNDRVWSSNGDWAHFVRGVLTHLGPGHEHLTKALSTAPPVRPLTMRPCRVTKVEDVGERPTLGIEIDDPQHTHVTDGILTHNTQQVSIGRVLRLLGEQPTARVVILQSSADVAKDTVSAIKGHIEHNERLHMVYPNLKPGALWTTHAISVDRPPGIRTPSVQARGAGGRVLGNRYDVVVVDDLLTLATTRTEYMRAQIKEWFVKEVMSRLLDTGAVWFLGNAMNPYDLMHDLVNQKDSAWKGRRFPVRDPVTGESLWPERWPQERIDEYARSRSPAEVSRALDCIARSEEDARFKEEWIDVALNKGRGMFGDAWFAPWVPAHYPMDTFVVTGVDLAFATSRRSDYTVLFTAAFHPDGSVDVLDIQRGKWTQDEVVNRMLTTHRRFKSTLFVESVSAQRLYVGILKAIQPDFPVYPFQTSGQGTTTNKHHRVFGIEALAFELSRGMWRFPTLPEGTPAPELKAFVDDLLAARLNDEHDADTIMSAWICLRGARDRGGFRYDIETIPLSPDEYAALEFRKQEEERAKLGDDPVKLAQFALEQEERVMQQALDNMFTAIGLR